MNKAWGDITDNLWEKAGMNRFVIRVLAHVVTAGTREEGEGAATNLWTRWGHAPFSTVDTRGL